MPVAFEALKFIFSQEHRTTLDVHFVFRRQRSDQDTLRAPGRPMVTNIVKEGNMKGAYDMQCSSFRAYLRKVAQLKSHSGSPRDYGPRSVSASPCTRVVNSVFSNAVEMIGAASQRCRQMKLRNSRGTLLKTHLAAAVEGGELAEGTLNYC